MSKIIDARGLSCPQPVMLTINELENTTETQLEILVDTDTAKENVTRAITSQGWQVAKIETLDDEYKIVIKK
ncbi:MAG: preprotein translocase subunit TatB [Firmicutes bacterium]|nr:preprotein translocase subunit TatB [Bacillota bacterium]